MWQGAGAGQAVTSSDSGRGQAAAAGEGGPGRGAASPGAGWSGCGLLRRVLEALASRELLFLLILQGWGFPAAAWRCGPRGRLRGPCGLFPEKGFCSETKVGDGAFAGRCGDRGPEGTSRAEAAGVGLCPGAAGFRPGGRCRAGAERAAPEAAEVSALRDAVPANSRVSVPWLPPGRGCAAAASRGCEVEFMGTNRSPQPSLWHPRLPWLLFGCRLVLPRLGVSGKRPQE